MGVVDVRCHEEMNFKEDIRYDKSNRKLFRSRFWNEELQCELFATFILTAFDNVWEVLAILKATTASYQERLRKMFLHGEIKKKVAIILLNDHSTESDVDKKFIAW